MMLDLSDLLAGVVPAVPFGLELDASGMSPDILSGKATACGEVKNHSGFILLKADISMDIKVFCARCAAEFDTVFTFKTEHKLTENAENPEVLLDEFVLITDRSLNLTERLEEDISLELPTRFFCREDCLGICPVCGGNRNDKNCGCKQKEIDPRLAPLAKYFEE